MQHGFSSGNFSTTTIRYPVVAENAMAVPTQKSRVPQFGSSLQCKER